MWNYRITSVLARARVAEHLPLLQIEAELGTHAQQHGSFLGFRIPESNVFVAARRNGYIEARGADSVFAASVAIGAARDKIARIAPISDQPLAVEILNIVATWDVGRPVDLRAIFQALEAGEVSYEPEQFPGMIIDLSPDRAKALLFASGKAVVTGVRSEESLKVAIQELASRLQPIL